MIVLGIDPGIAILGYGVVERCGGTLRAVDVGAVSTSPDLPLGERLHLIHTAVVDLIELHRPTLVAIERLFFTRNVQSAFAVGQARGVVLLAAAQAGVDVREATPSQVKTAVAGLWRRRQGAGRAAWWPRSCGSIACRRRMTRRTPWPSRSASPTRSGRASA